MRRIVLDTSVVVAGLRTQLGAGNAVLRLVATRRLIALATPPLFLEYEDVLNRPEHRLAHGLATEAIEEFLAELAALLEPVEVHFQWRPQSLPRMTRGCSRPRLSGAGARKGKRDLISIALVGLLSRGSALSEEIPVMTCDEKFSLYKGLKVLW